MRNQHRETKPTFCQNFDSVIFLADRLVRSDDPWNEYAVPRRVAARMYADRFVYPSFQALAHEDSFELVSAIGHVDLDGGLIAEAALAALESEWIAMPHETSRLGLREVVTHIQLSGLAVAFVSAMSELNLSSLLRTGLRLPDPIPSYGRLGSSTSRKRSVGGAIKRALSDVDSRQKSLLVADHSALHFVRPRDLRRFDDVLVMNAQPEGEGANLDVLDLAGQCDLTAGQLRDWRSRTTRRDRVRKLTSARNMTDKQMREYVDLTGGVQIISNANQFGYIDQEVGIQNAMILSVARREAGKRSMLLELLSVDVALLEIELRNWLVVHREHSFDPKLRQTFGQLVDLARTNGFSEALSKRLMAFNSLRNDAIHHLARGVETYFALANTYMRDPALLEDVRTFVRDGAPWWGERGEFDR